MSMGEPNDAPVLGEMSKEEVLAKLAEMDDPRVQDAQADITGQAQAEIRWP
jgi:hypothetical protein